MKQTKKEKVLLHICCAVCGAYLVKAMKEKFEVVLFYYNPNIHPFSEYEKRKKEVERLARHYEVEFIEGVYDIENWFQAVQGLEKEPEGGRRCQVCFSWRLERTARQAQIMGIKRFATTLGLSPHKSQKLIDKLGQEIAQQYNLEFIKNKTFGEKNEFWKKTNEKANKLNLYRQNYCGCVFSRLETLKKRTQKSGKIR